MSHAYYHGVWTNLDSSQHIELTTPIHRILISPLNKNINKFTTYSSLRITFLEIKGNSFKIVHMSIWQIISRLIPFVKPYRRWVIFSLVLTLLGAFAAQV